MASEPTPHWSIQEVGGREYLRVDRLPSAGTGAELGWARFTLPEGDVAATGDGAYVRPDPDALGAIQPEARRIARAADLELARDVAAGKVYVRFGPLPKGGRSKNYATGALEQGVSAYATSYDLVKNQLKIDFRGFLGGIFTLLDRPAYILRGDLMGYGSDGEPLLSNAQVARRLRREEVKRLSPVIESYFADQGGGVVAAEMEAPKPRARRKAAKPTPRQTPPPSATSMRG